MGQVLRTGNGRAEVLLGPGVFLRLGEHGALRMLDTRLEDAQVELQQGTALVEVVEMPKGSAQVLAGGQTVEAGRRRLVHLGPAWERRAPEVGRSPIVSPLPFEPARLFAADQLGGHGGDAPG